MEKRINDELEEDKKRLDEKMKRLEKSLEKRARYAMKLDQMLENYEKNENRFLCKICLNSFIDSAFMCGHVCCNMCGTNIKICKNQCPFCKKENVDIMRLYI